MRQCLWLKICLLVLECTVCITLSRNARKDGTVDHHSHEFVFTINLEVPSSALKLEQQVVYEKNILKWDLAKNVF